MFLTCVVLGLRLPYLPSNAHGFGTTACNVQEEPSRDVLRRRIEGLLHQELTTHWYPNALDEKLGGFHQNYARDWAPLPDDNRFLVYQARMTWTAAAFAEFSPPHRDEFVRYALQGIEYLDRVMRDEECGGFHWVLGPEGKLDPRVGDEKHVYGVAFVLYAASKVHEVAQDETALKVARAAFDWLERYAHDTAHGGYFEALTRQGVPITTWDAKNPSARRTDQLGVYYGFKSMNSHIHLLEALAEFSKVDERSIVDTRLREVFEIVRDRIVVQPGALNLYFTRDWRPTPAHDSFGHDVETAYLLVEAADALGIPNDERTWTVARKLIDHALDWGWDDEHGGFYDKGDAFALPAYDTKKVWWTQAEGLNALLLMHNRFGNESDRYWKAFLKEWAFIEQRQIDQEHGGWHAELARGGALIGDDRKASQWKANYHTARALINVARMLKQNARVLAGQEARLDAKDLPIPFERWTTPDAFGRTITFYISRASKELDDARLPLVLMIHGSGCQSLFQKRGEQVTGGLQNLLLEPARGKARVLVVEKPGVTFLDVAKRPGTAEGASDEFLREHTLDRWSEANIAALKAAWSLKGIDPSRTLVIGHSEGGIVAARVAAELPAVTHVASLSGGGPTQLFDLVEIQGQRPAGGNEADTRRQAAYAEWRKILDDPESITKFWLSHPYRRWSSFLKHSVLDELLRSKAKVYLAQGTEDSSVLVASHDMLVAELRARGRELVAERIEGADHGFRPKDAPPGPPKELQELFGRLLRWFAEESRH